MSDGTRDGIDGILDALQAQGDSGVAQPAARGAHNAEVAGSSPAPATTRNVGPPSCGGPASGSQRMADEIDAQIRDKVAAHLAGQLFCYGFNGREMFEGEPLFFTRAAALDAAKAAAPRGMRRCWTGRAHPWIPSLNAKTALKVVGDLGRAKFGAMLDGWPHAEDGDWTALQRSLDSIIGGFLARTGNGTTLSTVSDIEEHSLD